MDGQPEYGGASLRNGRRSRLMKRGCSRVRPRLAVRGLYRSRGLPCRSDDRGRGQAQRHADHLHQWRQRHGAEGSTVGTLFDQAALEAIDIPVADQLKFYDVWGSTRPSRTWQWAGRGPSTRPGGPSRSPRTSAAQGVASLAWHITDLGATHAVPPSDRHRADHPRSDGDRGAGDGQGHCLVKPIEGVSMTYLDKAARTPSTAPRSISR